jgi:hypothetical protein
MKLALAVLCLFSLALAVSAGTLVQCTFDSSFNAPDVFRGQDSILCKYYANHYQAVDIGYYQDPDNNDSPPKDPICTQVPDLPQVGYQRHDPQWGSPQCIGVSNENQV